MDVSAPYMYTAAQNSFWIKHLKKKKMSQWPSYPHQLKLISSSGVQKDSCQSGNISVKVNKKGHMQIMYSPRYTEL